MIHIGVCVICGSEWDGQGICPDCLLDEALKEILTGTKNEAGGPRDFLK